MERSKSFAFRTVLNIANLNIVVHTGVSKTGLSVSPQAGGDALLYDLLLDEGSDTGTSGLQRRPRRLLFLTLFGI